MGNCLGSKSDKVSSESSGSSSLRNSLKSFSSSNSSAESIFDYTFRVIVIGDTTTRSSNFIYRYTDEQYIENIHEVLPFEKFSDEWEETAQRRKLLEKIKIGEGKKQQPKNIKLFAKAARMIDPRIRGQSMRNPFRGMDGIILLYDITNPESLEFLEKLLPEIEIWAAKTAKCILVGTNAEKADDRKVTQQQAQQFASQNSKYIHNNNVFETNVTTGANVDETFHSLLQLLVEQKVLEAAEATTS